MRTYKRMKKKVKKWEKAPAITHNENDLWQDLTSRTSEKFNRVQAGKGDTQRPTNITQFRKNFDNINWKPKKMANGQEASHDTGSIVS